MGKLKWASDGAINQDRVYGKKRSLEEDVMSTLVTCFAQKVVLSFIHNSGIFIIFYTGSDFLRHLPENGKHKG